jgi:hypothetical protein
MWQPVRCPVPFPELVIDPAKWLIGRGISAVNFG